MLIFLMAASVTLADPSIESQSCKHLNTKYVSSEVMRINDVIYLNSSYGVRLLGALERYWKCVCSDERYHTNKHIVLTLSKLLQHEEGILSSTAMLFDIGPNLKAARNMVDAAIFTENAREEIRFQASAPIMPETGQTLSFSLECIRHKIITGEIDQNYCRYVANR